MRRTTLANQKDFGRSRNENRSTSPVKIPKKVLTSKLWTIRNDSSKVNAILHPDDHATPRMKHNEKIVGNVTKKCCLGSNNCYCREIHNIPRPSLIPRPTSCVSKCKIGKKMAIQNLRRSCLGCVCAGKEPQNKSFLRDRILKMKQDKQPQSDWDLKYSNPRINYEEYRANQENKYLEEVEAYREKERNSKESGVEISENEYYLDKDGRKPRYEIGSENEVDTILGTQRYGTQTSTSNSGYLDNASSKNTTYKSNGFTFAPELDNYYVPDNQPEDFQNPEFDYKYSTSEFGNYYKYNPDTRVRGTQKQDIPSDIPEFRRTYFFETHDIGRIGKSSQDHTCVHQFVLDDRMLPEPLNKDVFGRSLCKICEKPMDGTSNLDKSSLGSFSKPSYSRIKNLAKCSEYGLSPKLIHIGSGKSQIELILGKNDLDALSTVVHKLKRTEYCNSLALRHQKMRII